MTEQARTNLLRVINGYKMSQAVHVAAALGIADLLAGGPRKIADLAAATQTDPRALYRLMRVLSTAGVFKETAGRDFTLTPMSEFLRRDVPGSHAFLAQLAGRPSVWQAWGGLLHTVRTGATAFDHVHGRSIWDFRECHPEDSAIFDRAMAFETDQYADAIIDAYDFSGISSVVDVGGGDGAFLTALLARHPKMRGTLFDQPHVVAKSRTPALSAELAHRCHMVAGDFFAEVPAHADAYVLKWILHDWDDDAAIDILRSCGRAMRPASKLLAIEHVIGPPNSADEGKILDLTMMVTTGGRERTLEEFSALFISAGFCVESVVPTASHLSLIEAAPL